MDIQSASSAPHTQPAHSHKKYYGLAVALALVAALATGLGVYAWSNMETTDLQSRLDSAESSLKSSADRYASLEDEHAAMEMEPTPASDDASSLLLPGQVDVDRTDGKVHFTTLYDPSTPNVTALWVEYGQDVTKLDKSSPKTTSELGMGGPGYSFGRVSVVDKSQLESGQNYFYRVAATQDGKTIYSPIAGFTMSK